MKATHPLLRLTSDIALACLWGVFAWRYLSAFLTHPHPGTLLFFIAESIVVVLFLARSPVREASGSPLAWGLALFGTAAGTLFRPEGAPLARLIGEGLEVIGAAILVAGILSLSRSFGIVPANRGVRTRGAYAIVRHPMYAGYAIIYIGFLLTTASEWNAMILAVALLCMLLRAHAEEHLLRNDPVYSAYTTQVRHRFLPFIA